MVLDVVLQNVMYYCRPLILNVKKHLCSRNCCCCHMYPSHSLQNEPVLFFNQQSKYHDDAVSGTD